MSTLNSYKSRPIRFIELYQQDDWIIKSYSICKDQEVVDKSLLELAKSNLKKWLKNAKNYPLKTYKIATLILHQCKEGCFAIINWWIDENMLQTHVYLLDKEEPRVCKEYSHKGIFTCVWELEVLWFERNNWVKYVLQNASKPDYESYLKQQLNKD